MNSIASDCLAFLSSLICSLIWDCGVFTRLPSVVRAGCLGILGALALAHGDQPLLCAPVVLPILGACRLSLLSPGGYSLFVAIASSARTLAIQTSYFRSRADPKQRVSQIESLTDGIAAIAQHLAAWYFISRSSGSLCTWLATIPMGNHVLNWLWVPAILLDGGWPISTLASRVIQVYAPKLYHIFLSIRYKPPLDTINSLSREISSLIYYLTSWAALRRRQQHKYQILDRNLTEIRLLSLHAGAFPDVVRATLLPVAVSELPPFEAISYRWSASKATPILLGKQMFLVSGALSEMLRALRFADQDRLLWIDAICINQQDEDEKFWQIRMMTQIYRSADRVIAWLGSDQPFLPSAAGGLSYLRELVDEEREGMRSVTKYMADSILDTSMRPRIRAAENLICNEFFFRLWIIQEVSLGKEVVLRYADEELPWTNIFADAIGTFGSFLRVQQARGLIGPTTGPTLAATENIGTIEDTRQMIRIRPAGLGLNELLWAFTGFLYTEPRDVVFGVLGLCKEDAKRYLEGKTNGLLMESVISREAVRFAITKELSFSLLEIAGAGYLDIQEPVVLTSVDRPSWVPHWDAPDMHTRKASSVRSMRYTTATYLRQNFVDNDTAPGSLTVQGGLIDEVREVLCMRCPLLGSDSLMDLTWDEAQPLLAELFTWLTKAREMAQKATSHNMLGSAEILMWRTLCHQSSQIMQRDQLFEAEISQARNAAIELEKFMGADDDGITFTIDALLSHLGNLRINLAPIYDRSLCLTRQGRFGIVPPYARFGDRVCFLTGAPNPFVIREVSGCSDLADVDKRYRLIGVCYLEGVMQGELERANPPLIQQLLNLV